MQDKQYPVLFNQNNFTQMLGDSKTETIAAGGCFDSSLAMKANYYGHQTDPIQLNQLLTQQGVYVNISGNPAPAADADLLPDNALAKVYADVHYLQTLNYEPVPTDLGAIQTFLQDPAKTVTIRINLGLGNYHFVEAIAADPATKTLRIANPWTGQIEDFSKNYGNPVVANLHAIVYSGPTPVVVIPPTQAGATPLANSFNQAINKSRNFDTVAQSINMPNDQAVQLTAGPIVVTLIQTLQKAVKDKDAQILDLQTKLNNAATTPISPTPVVAPTTPVVPTVPPITPKPATPPSPAFSDGSTPVSSTPTKQVAPPVPTNTGRVGWNEFWAAVFHVLF